MTTQHGSLKEPQYDAPRTLEEALTRKRLLEHNIQILSVQLRSPDRTDINGRRLTSAEYRAWSARAHMKRVHMLSEHMLLKDYILRTKRLLRTPSELKDTTDPYMFVMSIRQALTQHKKDPQRMTLQSILDGIDRFLHEHKP